MIEEFPLHQLLLIRKRNGWFSGVNFNMTGVRAVYPTKHGTPQGIPKFVMQLNASSCSS